MVFESPLQYIPDQDQIHLWAAIPSLQAKAWPYSVSMITGDLICNKLCSGDAGDSMFAATALQSHKQVQALVKLRKSLDAARSFNCPNSNNTRHALLL